MLNWGKRVSARGLWRFPSQLGVGGRGRPIGPYSLYCDEKTTLVVTFPREAETEVPLS